MERNINSHISEINNSFCDQNKGKGNLKEGSSQPIRRLLLFVVKIERTRKG